jgi:hypothetical protein
VELSRVRRIFLRTLVASLCLTAALAIGTLAFGEFDDTAANILLTTTFLSVASLLSLPAGVLLDQGRATRLAWAVIAASTTGFAFAMVAVWVENDEDWAWKVALTLGVAALAGSQAAASTSRRRPEDGRRLLWLYAAGIAVSALLAVLIAVAAWREIEDSGYYRLVGATAIAAVLATLLQPIVRRLEGPAPARHELLFRLDRAPSEEAVTAAVDALAQHGVRADVVGRPPV